MAKNEKPKVGEPEQKTVTIPQEQLANILTTMEKMSAELALVKSATDVSRLQHELDKVKKSGPDKFKISTYDGKIIVGWVMTRDEAKVDTVTKAIREVQEYDLILEDGKKIHLVGYVAFSDVHYNNQIDAYLVSKTVDENGAVLHLKTADGKEIDIDDRFVN